MSTVRAALSGSVARLSAHSDNIANIETAGYRAKTVDFETSLRRAVAAGDPSATEVDVSRSNAPTRWNGSNVDVAVESPALDDVGLDITMLSQLVTGMLDRSRSVIRGL